MKKNEDEFKTFVFDKIDKNELIKDSKKKPKKKIKRKLKVNNLLAIIFFIMFLSLFIYSTYNIVEWYFDNVKIKNQTNIIEEITDIEEVNDSEDTIIIDQEKENPYWDYIKMKLINVNFDELKKTNKDVKGWIQVNGTNINYPFVQSNNNEYYLTHAFDKSYNKAGWIFLDYRNNINTLNKNTIIYGHSRVDKTMFGSLKNILKNNWYSNKDNYVIKLSTEKENTLWQVISIYHIPETVDYLQTTFSSDKEYQEFLNLITSRSIYDFNTSAEVTDNILTLSTCYYGDKERMVMHAKLIKKENR